MKAIIKRELIKYVRFPVYWIGIVIVFAGIYLHVSPYLNVHYFTKQDEIKKDDFLDGADYDIMDGAVPSTPEQQKKFGDRLIAKDLLEYVKMSRDEVNQILSAIKSMTMEETDQYLTARYGYGNAGFFYRYCEWHQGTVEEANEYIRQSLKKHAFSYYFSMKFGDFCGLYMVFFSIVLLAFLYMREVKRDTYELLHTKPISATKYVLGKITGGFFAMAVPITLTNIVFGGLCLYYGKMNGLKVEISDFLHITVCYLLPNMLMVVCVYTIISFFFHNPLPAVPLLVLYLYYSNMGSYGPDGRFGYYGRIFAIMVRFPGSLFSIAPPPMAMQNQCCLVAMSVVVMLLSVYLWRRRRLV